MGKSIDLGFKTPTDLYPFDEPFEIYSPTRSMPQTGTSSKPRVERRDVRVHRAAARCASRARQAKA
jgi:hypothetical protein